MSKTTRTDHAKSVLWQLAGDEEVQQHLATAATRLREAAQRVSHLRGPQVVEDKRFYDKVREAATSLARAMKLLGPEPEPPRKHRGRTLAGVALTAGAVAIVLKNKNQRSSRTPSAPEPAPAPPVASAPPVSAASP